MLELIADVEPRAYRRERCFHHHFVACLSRQLDLRLGMRNKPLRPEAQTLERYNWTGRNPRRGNMDFVVCDTGVELNYAYRDIDKISKDFIKLLDQGNGFTESAYLAFHRREGFRNAVEQGFQDALVFLLNKHQALCLSHRLDVIVVEDLRNRPGRGSLHAWEANVELLNRGTLDWHPLVDGEE